MASESTVPAARVRDVLFRVKGDITRGQARELTDLLAANEYGIALEWLVSYLADCGARVPEPTLAEIDDLARVMGITKLIADEMAELRART